MHPVRPEQVRAVVFDFDGLLMDTESVMLLSWQYEWRQWGLELKVPGFFASHGGDVTEDRYRRLAAAVGAKYDQVLSHQRRTAYRDRLLERLDLAEGLRGWLDEAHRGDLRLAVASSSPRAWVTGHLGRVGALHRFHVLASGDEVDRHKPAPDVYQLALSRLRLSAGATVAVEDTAHGVTAAQAAGLRCIAIPNPFIAPDLVRHADLVIESAARLTLFEALSRLASAREGDFDG